MTALPVRNYFADLGLGIDASAEQITTAYRRLAMELHPDRVLATPVDDPHGDLLRSANDRMAQVNAAYAVLSVAETREQHRDEVRALLAATPTERNGLGAVLTENGWEMPKGPR